MPVYPRPRARLLSLLTAAVVVASFLSATTALAPPSVAAKPAGCDSRQKIAFIAFPGAEGLEQMQAPLRELREIWPARKLGFRYMTSAFDTSPSGIDTVVDELETRVDNLEANGFKRIGLPSISAFLAPFIYGTAGSLGGQTIQQRHPNTTFVTMNPGTSAVDDIAAAGNVFRFIDVPSIIEATSLAVDNLVTGSGQMLIVFQNGDAVSESVRNQFLQIATDLGLTASSAAVDYNGSQFEDADMDLANLGVDTLPAGSLVVHVVNGDPTITEAYRSAAELRTMFRASSTNGPIRHFAGNFFPSSSIGGVLELGYQLVDRPSWQSTRAGFPSRYVDFQNDPRQKLYMDAYGFLARCGKFNGILDGFLRFDAGGTRINKELQRIYLDGGSTDISYGQRIDNERWYDDKVVWNWDQVFGE